MCLFQAELSLLLTGRKTVQLAGKQLVIPIHSLTCTLLSLRHLADVTLEGLCLLFNLGSQVRLPSL